MRETSSFGFWQNILVLMDLGDRMAEITEVQQGVRSPQVAPLLLQQDT